MSDRIIVLTERPGTIKDIHKINFEIENRNPINCRENPKFSKYFNMLWKELGVSTGRQGMKNHKGKNKIYKEKKKAKNTSIYSTNRNINNISKNLVTTSKQ